MLRAFNEAMPEDERLGDLLDTEEIPSSELKIGDEVWVSNFDGRWTSSIRLVVGNVKRCAFRKSAFPLFLPDRKGRFRPDSRLRQFRRLSGHGLVGLPPSPHGVHDGPQALPQLCEGVLDTGRDLRVDAPDDEPRVLHAAQVRREDLLGDAPDAALEGLEPHRAVQEQVPHYEQLPLATDKGHAGLHRAGGEVASFRKFVVAVLGIADFVVTHCIPPVH